MKLKRSGGVYSIDEDRDFSSKRHMEGERSSLSNKKLSEDGRKHKTHPNTETKERILANDEDE